MSLVHWLVVGLIVLLLFGRGRLPALMTDVAKGIKSFRAGMREEDEAPAPTAANPTAANPTAPQATVAPPASATPASEDQKTKV